MAIGPRWAVKIFQRNKCFETNHSRHVCERLKGKHSFTLVKKQAVQLSQRLPKSVVTISALSFPSTALFFLSLYPFHLPLPHPPLPPLFLFQYYLLCPSATSTRKRLTNQDYTGQLAHPANIAGDRGAKTKNKLTRYTTDTGWPVNNTEQASLGTLDIYSHFTFYISHFTYHVSLFFFF